MCLLNNTTDALELKVYKVHNCHPDNCQGGPLFFKIMMDVLQAHSEKLAENITEHVSNLKITDQQGKNVDVVVSLICGGIE